MKFIDEVDLELVNQELNFHSQDNNLVIRGGCDLFTTKAMKADRKLFKTIDKHLDQILEDTQLSQSLERERKQSINSLFGTSTSPTSSTKSDARRSGSFISERDRRSSGSLINFHRASFLKPTPAGGSNLSRSLNGDAYMNEAGGSSHDDSTIDESPFGPLKNSTTRKTFAYLIAILNTTYPDHDFSNLQPSTENFHKLSLPEELMHKFNNVMVSLGKKDDLLEWIWDTINLYMDLIPPKHTMLGGSAGGVALSRHNCVNGGTTSAYTQTSLADSPPLSNQNTFESCQIYEFQPTDQSILEDLNYPYQAMWSNFWFIYNRKKKRVAFLYLTAVNKIHYSLVNNGRSSSFSRRRRLQNAANIEDDEAIDDDDGDEQDLYMDEYMDEEVMIDDDDEDIGDDVVGDIEI